MICAVRFAKPLFGGIEYGRRCGRNLLRGGKIVFRQTRFRFRDCRFQFLFCGRVGRIGNGAVAVVLAGVQFLGVEVGAFRSDETVQRVMKMTVHHVCGLRLCGKFGVLLGGHDFGFHIGSLRANRKREARGDQHYPCTPDNCSSVSHIRHPPEVTPSHSVVEAPPHNQRRLRGVAADFRASKGVLPRYAYRRGSGKPLMRGLKTVHNDVHPPFSHKFRQSRQEPIPSGRSK
jgi:hypothetical protein